MIIASSVWGMAYFKGFTVTYCLIVAYFLLQLVNKRRTDNSKLFKLSAGTVLLYLCCIMYLFGLLITNEGRLYFSNTEDIINMFSVLMLHQQVSRLTSESYAEVLSKVRKLVVASMFLVSFLALYKYYLLTQGVYLQQYYFKGHYIIGASLISDNNMFALAMLIGFIFAVTLIRESSYKMRVLYLLASVPIFLTVALSGSRRSYVIMSMFLMFMLLRWLKNKLTGFNVPKAVRNAYFILLFLTIGYTVMYAGGYKINLHGVIEDPQIQMTINRFATVNPDNVGESFLPRSDRWDYALELVGQSSWSELLFGRGFNYLDLYVDRFVSYASEDYPHNPVLSALLYSGVIGMLVVVSFIILAVSNAVRYRNILGNDFLLVYLSTLAFIMISGNSIFTYKLFLILTTLVLVSPRLVEMSAVVKSTPHTLRPLIAR